MAQGAYNPLRTVSYRLSTASEKQLSALIPSIVPVLLDCKSILSSQSTGPKHSEDRTLVHKYKTQVNSLLNDKFVSSRWAAVALIKTTIDVGGWPILKESGPWIRGILSILGKNDPPATKKLCIVTLTRIFSLANEYPTLARELITPSLPQYITSCISLISPKSITPSAQQLKSIRLLTDVVLGSFRHLLPDHPTIFRPYADRLRSFILSTFGSNGSFRVTEAPKSLPSPSTIESAQSLFALLSFTSTKGGSAGIWNTTFDQLITETHDTLDLVFRSISEEWKPSEGGSRHKGLLDGADIETVQQNKTTAMGLRPWFGIHAGCERVEVLLGMMRSFISAPTASQVLVPIKKLLDLISRLLLVTIPSNNNTSPNLRVNSAISQDERDGLWSNLPNVHIATLRLILTFFDRFGKSCQSVYLTFLELTGWIFQKEKLNDSVRLYSYLAMSYLVDEFGTGFSRVQVKDLEGIVKTACEDVVPSQHQEQGQQQVNIQTKSQGHSNQAINAETGLHFTHASMVSSELRSAALDLITAFLYKTIPQHMSNSTRSLLERTAILANDPQAMLAATLNAPSQTSSGKTRSSILPFLARAHPESVDVEGFVRPRMPPISSTVGQDSRLIDEANATDEEDSNDPNDSYDIVRESQGSHDENEPTVEGSDKRPSKVSNLDEPHDEGGVQQRLDLTALAHENIAEDISERPDAARPGMTTVDPRSTFLKRGIPDTRDEDSVITKRTKRADGNREFSGNIEAIATQPIPPKDQVPVQVDDNPPSDDVGNVAVVPSEQLDPQKSLLTDTLDESADDDDDENFRVPEIVQGSDSDVEEEDE